MSGENGKTHRGKSTILRPAIAKEVEVVEQVRERVVELGNAWLRIRGILLRPPDDVRPYYDAFRLVVERHRKGDFRISDSEVGATKELMRWAYEMNCLLRNQPIERIGL